MLLLGLTHFWKSHVIAEINSVNEGRSILSTSLSFQDTVGHASQTRLSGWMYSLYLRLRDFLFNKHPKERKMGKGWGK